MVAINSGRYQLNHQTREAYGLARRCSLLEHTRSTSKTGTAIGTFTAVFHSSLHSLFFWRLVVAHPEVHYDKNAEGVSATGGQAGGHARLLVPGITVCGDECPPRLEALRTKSWLEVMRDSRVVLGPLGVAAPARARTSGCLASESRHRAWS